MSQRGGKRAAADRRNARDLQRMFAQEDVVKLRAEGFSRREVADQLGISRVRAWRLETEASERYAESIRENLELVRDQEVEKLELLQEAHWDSALEGDVRASEMILKLMARKAALLGLDVQPGGDAAATFNIVLAAPWERGEVVDGDSVRLDLPAGDTGGSP